jgi:4'-phosphopantetheinyl transferase
VQGEFTITTKRKMAEKENRFENFVFIQKDQFDWNLEGAVHIWRFPVLAADFSLLTDAERIVAIRFRFEADRNRYVTGRRSLRLLLSNYLSVSPSEISIISEKGQKPFIKNPGFPVRFNISHSGQWVVIALAKNELGIDIEKVDSAFDYSSLLLEHFSVAEQQFVSEAEVPADAFYFLWTRKEALMKAEGLGLQENLKTVSTLDERVISGVHKKHWKIKSFRLSHDYPVSLAYSGSPVEIGYFDGSLLLSG